MKASLVVAVLIAPLPAFAQRVTVEPSIEISEVSDNNLSYSPADPLSDHIHRVTPNVAFHYDSPRCAGRALAGIDSERYATHSTLDNNLARERARLAVECETTSRLTLGIEGSWLDTNTLADLNADTGLAGARVRGRQFSAGPSMRFRISPRATFSASASSLTTNVINGIGMRSQLQNTAVEIRTTQRDHVRLEYQHSDAAFQGETAQTIRSTVLLAGWTHDLSPSTRWTVRGGPRFTDGTPSADVYAAIDHDWRSSSVAFSVFRTQTTVAGYSGVVDTESAQLKLSYSPGRRLVAYAAPAWIRSTRDPFSGTVYRLGGGLRFALTRLVALNIVYNDDRQNGAIDPLLANADFSHATFSLGLIRGPGQMR